MAKPDPMPDVGKHDVQVAARSGMGTAGAVIAGLNVAIVAAALIKKAFDR